MFKRILDFILAPFRAIRDAWVNLKASWKDLQEEKAKTVLIQRCAKIHQRIFKRHTGKLSLEMIEQVSNAFKARDLDRLIQLENALDRENGLIKDINPVPAAA